MSKLLLVKAEGGRPTGTLAPELFVEGTTAPLQIEACVAKETREGAYIMAKNTGPDVMVLERNAVVSKGYFMKHGEMAAVESVICRQTKPSSADRLTTDFKKELEAKLQKVPSAYIKEYKAVLETYADVFSKDPDDVGKCPDVKQTIRLLDENKVSATPPYRMPHHLLPIAHEYVKKLLKLDIIRPSTSPFSSPLMLVRKPGKIDPSRPLVEHWRVVHDYRRLNATRVIQRRTRLFP